MLTLPENIMETIVGTEIVDGHRLGHTWHEVCVLKAFINHFRPDVFAEIGVHEGVLSQILIPFVPKYYIGVEINCQIVLPEVQNLYHERWETTNLVCGDCFEEDIIFNITHQKGIKMIYCDGGNKARELDVYHIFMNPGDIIMTHDFNDGTRWGHGLPEPVRNEVYQADIQSIEDRLDFERLDTQWPNAFRGTRIVAFRKK